MNDQSSGIPHEPPDDDPDDARRELAAAAQRRLMEQRARLAAGRDHVESPSRWLQHTFALIAALVVVLIVTFGFDAFLSSLQKLTEMLDRETQRQEEAQKAAEPMPAYVVPPEQVPPEDKPTPGQ